MRCRKFLGFFAVVMLQTWLLPLFTALGNALQTESSHGQWAHEREEFGVSLSSFLPTAALKDQSLDISQKCVKDSRLVLEALLNHTEWALSGIIYFYT